MTIDSVPVYLRGGSIVPRKERARRSTAAMAADPITLVRRPRICDCFLPPLVHHLCIHHLWHWLVSKICQLGTLHEGPSKFGHVSGQDTLQANRHKPLCLLSCVRWAPTTPGVPLPSHCALPSADGRAE